MIDSHDTIAREIESGGWVLIPSIVPIAVLEQLRTDLAEAYATCREIQKQNGVEVGTDGTVHHVLALAPGFLELFEFGPIQEIGETFFGGKVIVNSYGGVINLPDKPSYVCRVHRDVRTFSGDTPTMLNLLVMLDDFTEENGATWLLTGGHRMPERPSDEYFYQHAARAIGPAGSLLFFNSNLWHAAGVNRTTLQRRALTITITRPFIKQQLDYCRHLGYDACERLSPKAQQLIGYNARVPTNLNEWYRQPSDRFYKPGQG